jgi:inner membrane protein
LKPAALCEACVKSASRRLHSHFGWGGEHRGLSFNSGENPMRLRLPNTILIKTLGLLLLTLLLYIPLGFINDLIQERGWTRQQAADELASTYTGAQTLAGPLLMAPYVRHWTEERRNEAGKVIGREARSSEALHVVFPDTLNIEGRMTPEERYRGIFKILFYRLDASLDGRFPAFDPAAALPPEPGVTIEWRTPYLLFNVSDPRGLDGSPALRLDGQTPRFEQRVAGQGHDAGLGAGSIRAALEGEALASWRAGKPLPFSMKFALMGQQHLGIVPLAGETAAHISSPWAHPSFGGEFLAVERAVTAQGFDARWRVSSLATSARDQVRASLRGKPRQDNPGRAVEAIIDEAAPVQIHPGGLQSFDVSLAEPLNVYAMATRAGKYGLLFIGLVLSAAFMFEIFKRLRLHPVQYGMVGLSIALFFLLLLALSEKVAFRLAYAGAAGASVLLLGIYFSAVLGRWRRGAGFGAYVAALYGALYGLLASESNALLLGALLVFGMLAVLMIATRRVDWYALSATRTETPAGDHP